MELGVARKPERFEQPTVPIQERLIAVLQNPEAIQEAYELSPDKRQQLLYTFSQEIEQVSVEARGQWVEFFLAHGDLSTEKILAWLPILTSIERAELGLFLFSVVGAEQYLEVFYQLWSDIPQETQEQIKQTIIEEYPEEALLILPFVDWSKIFVSVPCREVYTSVLASEWQPLSQPKFIYRTENESERGSRRAKPSWEWQRRDDEKNLKKGEERRQVRFLQEFVRSDQQLGEYLDLALQTNQLTIADALLNEFLKTRPHAFLPFIQTLQEKGVLTQAQVAEWKGPVSLKSSYGVPIAWPFYDAPEQAKQRAAWFAEHADRPKLLSKAKHHCTDIAAQSRYYPDLKAFLAINQATMERAIPRLIESVVSHGAHFSDAEWYAFLKFLKVQGLDIVHYSDVFATVGWPGERLLAQAKQDETFPFQSPYRGLTDMIQRGHTELCFFLLHRECLYRQSLEEGTAIATACAENASTWFPSFTEKQQQQLSYFITANAPSAWLKNPEAALVYGKKEMRTLVTEVREQASTKFLEVVSDLRQAVKGADWPAEEKQYVDQEIVADAAQRFRDQPSLIFGLYTSATFEQLYPTVQERLAVWRELLTSRQAISAHTLKELLRASETAPLLPMIVDRLQSDVDLTLAVLQEYKGYLTLRETLPLAIVKDLLGGRFLEVYPYHVWHLTTGEKLFLEEAPELFESFLDSLVVRASVTELYEVWRGVASRFETKQQAYDTVVNVGELGMYEKNSRAYGWKRWPGIQNQYTVRIQRLKQTIEQRLAADPRLLLRLTEEYGLAVDLLELPPGKTVELFERHPEALTRTFPAIESLPVAERIWRFARLYSYSFALRKENRLLTYVYSSDKEMVEAILKYNPVLNALMQRKERRAPHSQERTSELHAKDELNQDVGPILKETLQNHRFYPLFAEEIDRELNELFDGRDEDERRNPKSLNGSGALNLAMRVVVLEASPAWHWSAEIGALSPSQRTEAITTFTQATALGLVKGTTATSFSEELARASEFLARHLTSVWGKEGVTSPLMTPGLTTAVSSYFMGCEEAYYPFAEQIVSITSDEDYREQKYWGKNGANRAQTLDEMKEAGILPRGLSLEAYEAWANPTAMRLSELLEFGLKEIAPAIQMILSQAIGDQHIEKNVLEVSPQQALDVVETLSAGLAEKYKVLQDKLAIQRVFKKQRGGSESEHVGLAQATQAVEKAQQELDTWRQTHEKTLNRAKGQLCLEALRHATLQDLDARQISVGKARLRWDAAFELLEKAFVAEAPDFRTDIMRIKTLLESARKNVIGETRVTRTELVVDTVGELEAAMRIGAEPVASCQHFDSDGKYNGGLMSLVFDPNGILRVKTATTPSTSIARAVGRLLEDREQNAACFIERVYSNNPHPKVEEALLRYAMQKAQACGAKLFLGWSPTCGIRVRRRYYPLRSRGSRTPKTYSDAGGGLCENGEFTIEEVYEVIME